MPRHDQHCLVCDWSAEIVVAAGEQPPCPQCGGTTERLWRSSASTKGDDIPGGLWVENLGKVPVKVYSHTERLTLMKQAGLEECIRHRGVNGTDKSPYTSDWSKGSIDPQTLANAAALVARASSVRSEEPAVTWEHPPTFTVREIPA